MKLISFEELYLKARKSPNPPERMLCLDPGETTGWALFHQHHLVRWGQQRTVENEKILWNNLLELFQSCEPTLVVCEDYRIYQHKLQRHSFSPVLTLRLIGGIDLLCTMGWYKKIINLVPLTEEATITEEFIYHEHLYSDIHYQMATTAKGFVTDDRLKEWGFWQEGMRHSRDAIRHGCYYLLFHK